MLSPKNVSITKIRIINIICEQKCNIKVLSINEKKYSVLTMYYSTILVSIFTTIGTVITVVLGAFAFARLNFKGREVLFSLLLATMMIPGEIYIISNYQLLSGQWFMLCIWLVKNYQK